MSFDYMSRGEQLRDEIITNRRTIHGYAETGFDLEKTVTYVMEQLSSYGYRPRRVGKAGVTCTVGKEGKVFLLRGDMDALPMAEETGLPFAANNGNCHSCGHDCHAAMLLGAARILQAHREELKGTVKLIFQMAEEIGRKSEEYVKRGALEGVDAIFGMHVWSALEKGKANFEAGGRMACSDRFTIQIHGKAAHGSAPHQGHDAVLAAAAAVMALQSLSSRVINPLDCLVVSVGMMNGGTKENILCDHVELVGTVRAFDRDFRNSMPQRIQDVVTNVVQGYGCTADCDYYFGPSPLINDQEDLNRLSQNAARKIMGEDCLVSLDKMMGAEDFSVYMEHIPGVYGYLGFKDPNGGTEYIHHHPAFDVDESVLWNGTGIYVQFAVDYLEEKA